MTPAMHRLQRALGIGVAALAFGASAATTMYRCGPDGRTWSQMPCRDGLAVQVDAELPTERVEQARDVAARDGALADKLQQERLRRDATLRKEARGAAGLHTGPRLERAPRAAAARDEPKGTQDRPRDPRPDRKTGPGDRSTTLRASTPAKALPINAR